MFRRSGCRFADKNMRKTKILVLRQAPVAPAVGVNYHGVPIASQGMIMSKSTKPEAPPADIMRALVEMRGLDRAYEKFPETVTTAFERGRRPIGSFPENFSPLTEPASRFAAEPNSRTETSK
jgi:hypothetical protein